MKIDVVGIFLHGKNNYIINSFGKTLDDALLKFVKLCTIIHFLLMKYLHTRKNDYDLCDFANWSLKKSNI